MSNVREEDLIRYLQKFHEVYRQTVERFIDSRYRSRLERYSRLPSKIIGYVSTSSGAGYEYVAGNTDEIAVTVASRPVEELLFDAPKAVRQSGPMFSLDNAQNVMIGKLTLQGAFPLRMKGLSSVRLFEVRTRAGSWEKTISFAEIASDRSAAYWSESMAIARAKDEVLSAQVDIDLMRKADVRLDVYLKSFKERHVLVLGDFSPAGRQRIQRIKALLSKRDYIPFVLDDISEHPEYDLRQKLLAVAHVARFVVIDDSSKSGQLAEMPEIDAARVIAIVLRKKGSKTTFVTRPLSATSNVIIEEVYTEASLAETVDRTCQWAEAKIKELKVQRDATYPWRTQ